MKFVSPRQQPSAGSSTRLRQMILFGLIVLATAGGCLASQLAVGQDRVVIRSSGGERTLSGIITEWTGENLTLKNSLGREAVLPANSIVQVRDAKSKTQQQAEAKFAAGQYAAAEELFMQAAREDSRQWKQRQMVADISRCYFEQSSWVTSAKRFLRVVEFDPTTPSFDAIPLFWKSAPLTTDATQQAVAWLGDEDPTTQLIAASWLLESLKHRDAAISQLKTIAASNDQRHAALATSQLWRQKTATVTSAELDRWEKTIQKMPRELKAGPWFLLAKGLSQQSRFQEAAAAAMHVPALFPKHRSLAAEALLLAGSQLKRAGVADEAANLFREVAADYPGTAAAAIAAAELSRATPKQP